ncbi:hypothetical protein HELRODRAFT_191974 [Helobdella robusta]|uniref:Protein kinase domain-containing protein n=1 Tax=Helobdella robusta TaxID=6412 RepID=T1FTH1_HELRO|nr:hypothetical protein HELRODRAFT_191974 [Helobdella robusta]ESO03258.1 hypothetical protein HELRODRAFT_191974 [Helobdella robusta]
MHNHLDIYDAIKHLLALHHRSCSGMCNKRVSRRFDVLSQLQKDNIEMYYEVGSVLGSGKFATVRVCRNKQTSKTFAGKFVRRRQPCRTQQMCQPRSKGDVQTEINILQSLSLHENIIRLFEVYEGPLEVVLMLELISGGELFHYLVKRERVSEDEGVFFLKQVLQATQYMHAKNIVHLDLKPENLMLESEVSKKLKIIDFGLSVQLSESVEWRELTGTPEFVAPEVINFDPVTAAADIWSIGVIAFITLSGFSPFLADDKQATLANVSRAEYEFDENYFKTTSHLAKDFIQNLLVKNPRKRPTATECLEHPWINVKLFFRLISSSSTSSSSSPPSLSAKRHKRTGKQKKIAFELNKLEIVYGSKKMDAVLPRHLLVQPPLTQSQERQGRNFIIHRAIVLDNFIFAINDAIIINKIINSAICVNNKLA